MKIIILHGWGHSGELWKNLATKFGKNAKALDLPGFGDEPLVKDDWGIPEYADWVIRQIDKKKDTVLIGHSFGGRIAAEVASKNPKLLKGLVLTGAPCLYRPSTLVKAKIKIYKLLKVFMPKGIKVLFYSEDLKRAGKLEKIFRNIITYDQSTSLKKIIIPTLLIWGESDDQVQLHIAHEMEKLIPNSQLKIIENAGHNAFLNKPDLFFGYVKNFINNLSDS